MMHAFLALNILNVGLAITLYWFVPEAFRSLCLAAAFIQVFNIAFAIRSLYRDVQRKRERENIVRFKGQ